jgi:hypothetical protein
LCRLQRYSCYPKKTSQAADEETRVGVMTDYIFNSYIRDIVTHLDGIKKELKRIADVLEERNKIERGRNK